MSQAKGLKKSLMRYCIDSYLVHNFFKKGIVILLTWVETGDILFCKLIPQPVKELSYASEDRLF